MPLKLSQKISPFGKTLARVLVLAFILLAVLHPSPALAAALRIESVSPSSISNAQPVTITIYGAGFQQGCVAYIKTSSASQKLATSGKGTQLSATIPAGLKARSYAISVVNPDNSEATKENALTITIPPANTPPPTPPVGRPIITVKAYKANINPIHFGEDFSLVVTIANEGVYTARNIQATFSSGDMIPRNTGGVMAVGELVPNNKLSFDQPMTAATGLWGKTFLAGDMSISYVDDFGNSYAEKFSLVLPLEAPAYLTETPTPLPSQNRPQLVITRYATSSEPLQPGTQFTLDLGFSNVGLSEARGVVMILGGGSASPGTGGEGTPSAGGGISGGSGEFTNFAPLGASNIQSLGNLGAGLTFQAKQSLVVNTSTSPGAYPLKISFTYLDDKGAVYTDDQVITLLVYRLPNVDINFYRTPDPLMAGQMGILPLQIVNIGRNSAILGTMHVEVTGASLENSQTLVGALESGGFFTLDTTIIPELPGPLELKITVDYTDDFNQPRSFTKTISVDVIDMPIETPPPGGEGEIPTDGGSTAPETFLHKVWRFILGLLGLDSAAPSVEPVPGEITPDPNFMPVPIPGGKG